MREVDEAVVAWATGIWGALVGYLSSRSELHPLGVASLLLHCICASFAAWLVYLVCVALEVQSDWIAVYTGLAGYLGVESIRPLEGKLRDLLNR